MPHLRGKEPVRATAFCLFVLAFLLSCSARAENLGTAGAASLSVHVVTAQGSQLIGVVDAKRPSERRRVRIRTTSATEVWEGQARRSVATIRPGDTVFARGQWLNSHEFAALILFVNLVNEYGIVNSVGPAQLRLRLVDRNSFRRLAATHSDTVLFGPRTLFNGLAHQNPQSVIHAGSLIEVFGNRRSSGAVTATNVVVLKFTSGRRGD
jgi:hypothetical protein